MKVNAKGERLAKVHTGEKVLSREEAEKVINCSHVELYDGDKLLGRFEEPFALIIKDEATIRKMNRELIEPINPTININVNSPHEVSDVLTEKLIEQLKEALKGI